MTYDLKTTHVGLIGLGYVGMPLALTLSKHMRVTGFDIYERRVQELQDGIDSNREIATADLKATQCKFTSDANDLKNCNVYIVTVPTPLDEKNNPDLSAVKAASKTVAAYLKKGDIVVYESTVYPGVTEDVCAPVLEKESGLKSGKDFFLGYSPERINPGDTQHTVDKITKVVAGQTPEITDFLATLYGTINGGNIFKARDIRTAEASKAIENAQRDINVAFINEVTMVLGKLGLSTYDVLEAAGTKWNFLPFLPGLVGGHCIGVDPYYLAHCAESVGHHPEVILAGRRINDNMGFFVANQIHISVKPAAKILLLGFTFKENITDIRNTKVVDIVKQLQQNGHSIDIHDPHARPEDVEHEYDLPLLPGLPQKGAYDCVVLAVAHKAYRTLNPDDIAALLKTGGLVYDLKGLWRKDEFDPSLHYKTL